MNADDKQRRLAMRAMGLGTTLAYEEMCPGGCGRDRFDHEIMKNPCDAYKQFLADKAAAEAVRDGE